jgi:hypothetical protein
LKKKYDTRAAHLLSGTTRRATHATARQRGWFGNLPRAPLPTPLGARAFRSVRGRGSGTESRRFGVRGREHPKPRIYISTCSRASPAGRGWTAAAGSANASGSGWKGTTATSRTHRQVRRNARVAAAGSTARFRNAFFSRRPLFLAFSPRPTHASPLPSPPPTEEEEQVYAQLATLKEHLPTRYAPRRPANARVERTPHLPSTRRSAGCRTHSPSFRLFFLFLEINGSYPEHRARPPRRESKRAPLRPPLARARI